MYIHMCIYICTGYNAMHISYAQCKCDHCDMHIAISVCLLCFLLCICSTVAWRSSDCRRAVTTHCTSGSTVVARLPRWQHTHMHRQFANFIRISPIAVAGWNKRVSVASCRLNRCLSTVDCKWFMGWLPLRARAAMGIRTIPVEEVTPHCPHTANKELKCIQKENTTSNQERTQFSKVD